MTNEPLPGDRDSRRWQLLYPERRGISATEIMSWARDEWHNHASAYRCNACAYRCNACDVHVDANQPWPEGECLHDADTTPVYSRRDPALNAPPTDIHEALDYLEDLGVATFARPS